MTPGVVAPVASRGSPLGSAKLYVTVIAPALLIRAELMVITKPGLTKSRVA